jgi:hypothetical protein
MSLFLSRQRRTRYLSAVMPWWIRHWFRDAPAILAVAVVLVGLVGGFAWFNLRPPSADHQVEGRITGFQGRLIKGEFRNEVLAAVRLTDGRRVISPMPQWARGAHCRVGDPVKLVENGGLYRLSGQGCPGL